MEETDDEIPPILVINDDPETLQLIARTLDEEGFEVKQAENGRRALFMLTGFRPLLIVTDMMMPEMNGLEFCKQLGHYDVNDIPVLVVTSASDKSRLMREFFELPLAGRGYLKEPFEPQALARKVLEMLDAADEGREYSDGTGAAPVGERTEGVIKPMRLGRKSEEESEAPPATQPPTQPTPQARREPPPPKAQPPRTPPPKATVAPPTPPPPKPLAQGKAKLAPRAPRPAPEGATPPPAPKPPTAGPRLRVLVVDDDPATRDTLRMTLEGRHEVLTAGDGMEAIAALDDFQPDFVICDISLPVMDGFATVEAIRHHPLCGSIPVFFLSGEQDSKLPRKAFAAGGNLFLTKPILPSRLINLIDRFVDEADLRPRAKVAIAKRPERPAQRRDDAPTPASTPRVPVRILAVDDNPGSLALIRRALEMNAGTEGWELIFSADPREAVAHLARWEPDAILYNPRCRNLDGIAFVQTLRMKKLMASLELAFFGKEFFESDHDYSERSFGRGVIKISDSEQEIANALHGLAAAAAEKARPKTHSIELVLAEDELRRGQAQSKQNNAEMQRDIFRAKFGKLQQFIDEEK